MADSARTCSTQSTPSHLPILVVAARVFLVCGLVVAIGRYCHLVKCEMEFFDTDKFICMVKGFPELWNKNNPEYLDIYAREVAWTKVMSLMYGKEVVKQWGNDKSSLVSKCVDKLSPLSSGLIGRK